MQGKKKLTPDVGIGYRATYKDKQTGEEKGYLRLAIRESELSTLTANDTGFISLSVFPMNVEASKRKDNTPDYVVKPGLTKKKGTAHAQQSTSRIPF